jgi:hypothetical protein
MKRVFVCILILIFPVIVRAEHVFLKNGQIIDCRIIGDANTSITIRDKNNKVETIARNQIQRINYTDIDLEKKYIQFRDGKGYSAYIVDEDQTSYTLRKELNNPDEFSVKRRDILFIADRNPSGLKGTASTTGISLSWLPSYDPVKKYNIYIKKKSDAKYELGASTASDSHMLENLKSNTTYMVIVKSIDLENKESPPSNEITVTTKNFPPMSPANAHAIESPSGDFSLTWNASADIDGTVTGYKVYVLQNGEMHLDGETKTESYTIKKSTAFNRITVRAVDNNKEESDDARVNFDDVYNRSFTVMPRCIYPFGLLKDMVNPGGGISFQYSLLDKPAGGFEVWADLGCMYLQGKKNIYSNGSEVNMMLLSPLQVAAGYRFNRYGSVQIEPWIGVGAVALYSKYHAGGSAASAKESELSIDALVSGGLRFQYMINYTSFVSLGAEGGLIIERPKSSSFAGAPAGFGIRR